MTTISVNYAVVQGNGNNDGEEFCKIVTKLMQQGYEPMGGVAVATLGSNVGFFQALIKKVTIENT